MNIKRIAIGSLFFVAGCGPSYVWGDDAATAKRLLEMVPQGSSLSDLTAEAARREWRLDQRNVHILEAGKLHYFDGCKGQGGPAVPVIVADYRSPFRTIVETLWLFDSKQRLAGVCVRRSVDAP